MHFFRMIPHAVAPYVGGFLTRLHVDECILTSRNFDECILTSENFDEFNLTSDFSDTESSKSCRPLQNAGNYHLGESHFDESA